MATTSERKWAGEARWWVEMLDSGPGEHDVGHDGPADAAGDLGRKVAGGVAPAQPAEGGVDEGHHRVEVGAGHRAEHQDDGVQPGAGGRGVVEQLEAGVSRGELLGGDTRADHDGGEEGAPEELGGDPPPQGELIHRGASAVRGVMLSSTDRGVPAGGAAAVTPASGARPSVDGRGRLLRGVGQHRVDLPRRSVGVGDPGLVLDGVAAGGVLLDRRGRAPRPTAGRWPTDLVGGLDLDPEVVERTGDAVIPVLGCSMRTSFSGG